MSNSRINLSVCADGGGGIGVVMYVTYVTIAGSELGASDGNGEVFAVAEEDTAGNGSKNNLAVLAVVNLGKG